METIPDSWFLFEKGEVLPKKGRSSYWKYEHAIAGVDLYQDNVTSNQKRIDEYWNAVGKVRDENGNSKYNNLSTLARCVFVVSHEMQIPKGASQ